MSTRNATFALPESVRKPGFNAVPTLLLMVAFVLPVLPEPTTGQEKELIAVIDVRPVSATDVEASALTDRLREELLRTGRFTLVDRSQMEAVLNEQALQQTGCTEQECAVQVGQILGVRKIVAGKVTRIADTLWQLSALMVDVETSETIRAESVQHRGDFFDLLTSQVPPLAAKLAGTLAADRPGAPAVTEPAPPPAPGEPPAASMGPRPPWIQYTGWALIGLGVLNQLGALSTNDDAEAKANEARANNSTSQYTEAQDLRTEAESGQSAAFLLTAGGLGLLYYFHYYLPAQGLAAIGHDAGRHESIPLRVSAVGKGARVGWSWQW